MSFHGGLIGVMVALAIFAVRRKRRIADVFDFAAPLPGIGICAGRIGNFINGELWGKPTDVPWGFMVDGEAAARDAALRSGARRRACCSSSCGGTRRSRGRAWRPRVCSSSLYSLARITVEFWRLPDSHLNEATGGYLVGHWFTMGMLLSLAHAAHRRSRSCSWRTAGASPRAISRQLQPA